MSLTSSLRTIWIRFVEWNLSRARQPTTGEMGFCLGSPAKELRGAGRGIGGWNEGRRTQDLFQAMEEKSAPAESFSETSVA